MLATQQLLEKLVLQTQHNTPAEDANISATPSPEMEEVDTSTPVHSIAVRQQFDWTPPEELAEILDLKQSPFLLTPLGDTQRKELIESYPPMRHIATCPETDEQRPTA